MKTHAQTLRSSSETPSRLGWLLLIPLLATSLLAQTGPELTIQHSTNGTCLLNWPVTTNDYVVLSATNVGGPWEPCLNRIAEAAGMCRMNATLAHETEYFRLVEGYYDDFEDGDLEGWRHYCLDPSFQNSVNVDVTNGQLRIHGTWSGERQTYCLYTNLTLANYVASVDILDWADALGNRMLCALLMRWETGIVTTNRQHYYGGVTVRETDSPPQSSIWLFKWWGTGGGSAGEEWLPRIHPANDYRLVCHVVGGQATAELYDLTDLSNPLETVTGTDGSPLPSGWSGIFANDKGYYGLLDVTFDNFLVYALP